jgi:hypothetical protein
MTYDLSVEYEIKQKFVKINTKRNQIIQLKDLLVDS